MNTRPKKPPPCQPYIQWRWVWKKEPRTKSIAHPDWKATSAAIIYARDHYVRLEYVTPTRDDGKISKADVEAYRAAGKPEAETSKPRYPNPPEMMYEICQALMHVTQQMMWNALPLWSELIFDEIDGVRTPVVILEWGVRALKSHARRLIARDNRFRMIPARATHWWGDRWGARR